MKISIGQTAIKYSNMPKWKDMPTYTMKPYLQICIGNWQFFIGFGTVVK